MANLKLFWDPYPGVTLWQIGYKLHSSSTYTYSPVISGNFYVLQGIKRCNAYDIELISICNQDNSVNTSVTGNSFSITPNNGTCGNQHARILLGNVSDTSASTPVLISVSTGQLNPVSVWYNASISIPFSGSISSPDYLVTSLDDPLTSTISITNNDTVVLYYRIDIDNNSLGTLPGSSYGSGNIPVGQTLILQDSGVSTHVFTLGESLNDYNIRIFFSKSAPI